MSEKHRYLFIVRTQFGTAPKVDSFYELQVPAGLSGEHAKVMVGLDDTYCKEEFRSDTHALTGMELRLRFNQDMFQKVCLVRSDAELSAEDLDSIIEVKNDEKTLMDWLESASVRL